MWPFSSPTSDNTSLQQPQAVPPSACPVDHSTREQWLNSNSSNPAGSVAQPPASSAGSATELSTVREVSSIPRWLPSKQQSQSQPSPSSSPSSSSAATPVVNTDSGEAVPPPACPARSAPTGASSASESPAAPVENWVYPSPSSFYSALQRKNRPADARDMDIVVPIHNAVNERVWAQVLEWERDALGLSGKEPVESKLVSFVGRPKDVSPRARWKTMIGYTAPFDRHDWIIDRPVATTAGGAATAGPQSQRIRYVIDFYTGRGNPLLAAAGGAAGSTAAGQSGAAGGGMPNLAFYIDCRPALDDYEGVRMRASRFWKNWFPSTAAAESGSSRPTAGQGA